MKQMMRLIPVLLLTLAMVIVPSAMAQDVPAVAKANPRLSVEHLAPFAPDP
jgi:hypothetical protein